MGYIELNCDNALTPFPYVDTVCEVLEDAVDDADENDLELAGLNAITTPPKGSDKAAVATAFQNAFVAPVNDGKEQIKLGADFLLSQVSPSNPNRWVVHGDDVTYLLKKKGTSPNFFAEILRNTKASAAELRAYPQYVNQKPMLSYGQQSIRWRCCSICSQREMQGEWSNVRGPSPRLSTYFPRKSGLASKNATFSAGT